MTRRILSSILAVVSTAFVAAPTGLAQAAGQSGAQSGGQGSGNGQAATGPSGGLSAGTAPIETTLFAYRALQSDAEAIAAKIREVRTGDRIVIGGQPDVAAFLQWRTVVGQADMLKTELVAMHRASRAPPERKPSHTIDQVM